MPDSTLFTILHSALHSSRADKAAALAAATAYLPSLSSLDLVSQLTYHNGDGWGVLHLLARWYSQCEQGAPFLSLVIDGGRESRGTTAQMSLANTSGLTPLHYLANDCDDVSLTKMVLREHPPSLAVHAKYSGWTPLEYAELYRVPNPERAVFLRAATTAFNASDFVTLVALCDGSSPYLARELGRQATALRAAVAISLNRQEQAPSALSSGEAGDALSLLERLRDFGRVGNSSDLLRRVLEYVGPYSE